MKNKNITKRIDFSDPCQKAKGMIFSVITSLAEIIGLYFAIIELQWFGLVISLVFPVAVYLSIKYTITAFKRGVQISGDYFIFEPEYKKKVKIHRNDIKSIYVSESGKGKLPDPEKSYKNKNIVFLMSDGTKHNYPLTLVSSEMVSNIRRELK